MQITVRFFAGLREAFGAGMTTLELPAESSVVTAWQAIVAAHPAVDTGVSLAYAVNRAYAEPTTILHDGDELALIPPVSGG